MNENEILVNDELNNEIEAADYEDYETSGRGSKLLVGALIAGVAGVAAFAYKKNKTKLEERRIEKLRKKGYVIYREDEVAEVREVEEDDVDVVEETE